MPFVAKSAAPRIGQAPVRQPTLDQAVEGGITLFTAPAGSIATESLAATLAEAGRPALWLRLGGEDGDPATFLISLITAARRLCPGRGIATLELMQRQPGPVAGWPPIFAMLARELSEALPSSAAVVFEYCHYLAGASPTLRLIAAYILPELARGGACILTSHRPLPRAALPDGTVHRTIHDISMTDHDARVMAERAEARLPSKSIRHAVGLADGRIVALAGIFAASAVLGDDPVISAIDRAVSMDDLLARLARAWLAAADDRARQSLSLALPLEYSQPALANTAPEDIPPHGPWLQPLADGWMHMQPIWQIPLRAVLWNGTTPQRKALGRAAGRLAALGAVERAIPLFLELDDFEAAAQVIDAAIDRMMNLGQWETLRQWLEQLPPSTLRNWPWLLYAGGELACVYGHIATARRSFAAATRSFKNRQEIYGMCQSLLAESALSAWSADYSAAQSCALAASRAAEAAGLTLHQGWANWQLGCLATHAGDLERASACFCQARAAAEHQGDAATSELVRPIESLLTQQRELRRQSEAHREAYSAAERAEHATAKRLRQLLSGPSENRDALLLQHGWARIPLPIKLALPTREGDDVAVDTGFWRSLLRRFDTRWRLKPAATPDCREASSLRERDILDIPAGARGVARLPARTFSALEDTPPSAEVIDPGEAARAFGEPDATRSPCITAALAPTGTTVPQDHALPSVQLQPGRSLTVYMLGAFRVMLNDRPIQSWPSGRGRAVFKYLLMHRDWPRPRDVLMDLFWPDTDPGAARNNLNVAIHGLRQALRAVDDSAVVVFQEGAYRLAPDLDVWVDVEEFDRHIQTGRRLEAAGQSAAAVAEYELAIGIYQGDFMEDDPYEEWALLTRERLRVAYLEALDRLSQIHFDQAQYGTCATLCQLILARDNCREDVHRRLMRCYSRQSQRYLALRQYQSCAEALRAELEIEPEPATAELYEQIRRRELV